MNGRKKEDKVRLFAAVPRQGTRGEDTLKYRSFIHVVTHWNRMPKEAGKAPSLDIQIWDVVPEPSLS